MAPPTNLKIKNDDAMYRLLREGKIEEFNQAIVEGKRSDLTNCDFRGISLRGLNTDGLDFRGCYFRQSDLRGVDFSQCNLDGASINGAKISGTLFPSALTSEEITLSLLHGTRMRYRTT